MRTSLRRAPWASIAIAGALFGALAGSADAQISPSLGDALQRAIQSGQLGQSPDLDQPRPPVQIYQPVIPERTPTAPSSRLEALYSTRAGRPLTQFGYDILGVPSPVSVVQAGSVQDNYVLGEGDEIVVILRGQENITYRQRVNRNGQIILPKLNPIQASGRSFGNLRENLEEQVARAYISTNAFISLGEVRQISVLITGEVRAPGLRVLNALATPLDAILLSGGIAKTGSLRNVALIRGRQTIPIDLYAILTQGALPDMGGMRNGDRIYIPPLQETVAVTGYVRRPGIYELRNGQRALNAKDLVGLAGGIEIAGKYRLSKTSLQPDGSTRLVSIPEAGPIAVGNGEVLFVDAENDAALERVTVAGAVRLNVTYPLSIASSVKRLIRTSSELACDAYTAFAVVVRRDPILNARTLLPFSLVPILSGGPDLVLRSDDFLYVFNRNEIRLLGDVATNQQAARLRPGTLAPTETYIGTLSTSNPANANPANPVLGAPGIGGQSNDASGTFPPPANAAGTIPPAFNGLQGATSALPPANASGQPFGMTPGCTDLRPQAFPQPQGQELASGSPFASLNGQYPGGGIPQYSNLPQAFGGQPIPGVPQTSAPQQFQSFPQPSVGQPLLNPLQTPLPQQYPGLPQTQQYPGFPQLSLGRPNPLRPLTVDDIAMKIGVPPEQLVRVAADHVIWVLDEVRDPGAYVAGEGTTLADIIETAGGLLRLADLSSVEVTSTRVDAQSGTSQTVRTAYKGELQDLRRVSLQPLDVIRLRPVFSDRQDGRVTVLGQVRYPGSFDITRGERLSSVLARVGGLTGEAYPYGGVFTRTRAALAERDANIRNARELDAQLATVTALTASETTSANSPSAIAFLSTLAQRVREAPVLGRITATLDPIILRMKPELDVILEPGDLVYVPSRPSTVTVSGEVLNPGSFQYRAGLTVRDYLVLAGGQTQGADKSRIFVIFPDGTAQPARESWLSFGNTNVIPPGSTVVVPRDLRPFNLTQFLRDATQITSQLAITAASFAVLNR
jgi:polysaccharide export outer membrane protein